MFPFWYFAPVIAIVLIALLMLKRTRRFRKEFGSQTSKEEIKGRYPKSWVFTFGNKSDVSKRD
jgi:Na+/proline symporter